VYLKNIVHKILKNDENKIQPKTKFAKDFVGAFRVFHGKIIEAGR